MNRGRRREEDEGGTKRRSGECESLQLSRHCKVWHQNIGEEGRKNT